MPPDTAGQISTDITSGVVYKTYGSVPTSARDEAEDLMARLCDLAPRPVRTARVKITNDDHRDPAQHSVVQGNIAVSDAVVRAQAAGPTAGEALRIVGGRLERRLQRLGSKRHPATQRPPASSGYGWSSGDPGERPGFYDRPSEERLIVRRKLYSPMDRTSVSQALFDMDVRDYRFFLFTDEADDKTSLVYEGSTGPVIRKVDGSAPDPDTLRPGMAVDETPALRMPMVDAVADLDESDTPFVFFMDTEQSRITVLYRRYDGHYGSIVPLARITPGTSGPPAFV